MDITMRWDNGEHYWIPQGRYGGVDRITLRVHWQNVKPEMAKVIRKRDVDILERTMVVDLLTNNGSVVGATAVNTRTGEFMVIKAKATIVATGLFARLYDPENTPVLEIQIQIPLVSGHRLRRRLGHGLQGRCGTGQYGHNRVAFQGP